MKYPSFLFLILSSIFLLYSHAADCYWSLHGNNIPENQAHSSSGFSFSIDQKSSGMPRRLCKQWDDFSRSSLYPHCSAKEINILKSSPSLAKDFVRAIDDYACQAMQQGLPRSHVEREVLSWHKYYRVPAFVDYIKSFSSYRSYIKEFRDRLVAQKVGCYCVKRIFSLLEDNFDYKLDLAEKLYAEILRQENEELEIAQKKQELQQELRRNQQEVRATFDCQRESLQQLDGEWVQVQDIYQEYGLDYDGRFERRKQALDAINSDGCIYETKSYTLSSQAKKFADDVDIDVAPYQTCYGNQLQQTIHSECIDGITRLATLPQTSVMYNYKENIAHCFDAAREYNRVGAVDKATVVADFCYTMLDYGKAIAEGVVEGVVDIIKDIRDHPIEVALTLLASELIVAYDVGRVLYSVADISITYALDSESGKKKWDECILPVTQLMSAIEKKEISLRDAVKGTTKFFTQWQARGKLYKGMGNLCKTAKVKALEFANKNRSVAPEQYMKMPEGVVFGGLYNGVVDNKNCKKNGGLDKVKEDLHWARHRSRHAPQKKLTWKEIIQTTKHGDARYHKDINIESLERHAWQNGIPVKNMERFKVFKADKIIGANQGKETKFMRIECTANTIHGHPISEADYLGYLKK